MGNRQRHIPRKEKKNKASKLIRAIIMLSWRDIVSNLQQKTFFTTPYCKLEVIIKHLEVYANVWYTCLYLGYESDKATKATKRPKRSD